MSGPDFFNTNGGQRVLAQVTHAIKTQAEATNQLAQTFNSEGTEKFMAQVRHHMAKQNETTSRIADALERIAKALEGAKA